ncbi:MAG: hypothetical protein OEW77_12910, partial [Gemmatimonadota bacterium]|nr:hypothetical protein [Gemmatimonadota bacterium]
MLRRSFAAVFCVASVCSPLAGQQTPVLTPADLGRWETLGSSRLSPDGAWLSYTITRGNQEVELRLSHGARDSAVVIGYGSGAVFSPDSRWFAYLVGVSVQERERLTKEKKPVHNALGARNLATGESIVIPDVSTFSFDPSGAFVAVTKYAAEGKKVSDVLVLDLRKGTRLVFDNVAESAWSDVRPLLAFTVMADGGAGNGVHVFDGTTGLVRVLESTPAIYRTVAWREGHDDVAVLRTSVDKAFVDTTHVILAWAGSGTGDAKPLMLDPSAARGFPAGVRVAEGRRPSWSKDGRTLFFGIRARLSVADAPKKSEEKVSDVEIWHTKDVLAIPAQRAAEQRDLRASMLAAWHLQDGGVVQLGSDPAESSAVLEGDAFITEVDRTPYAWGQKFGRRDEDLWAVDVATGARRKVLERIRHLFAASPTGTRVPWFDGRDYWVVDPATGTRTNLTAKLTRAGMVDFVDRDDDHPSDVLPPVGTPLWSKDGATMFVYSEYDIWALSLDGSGGRRITDGAREGVVHRIVSFVGLNATPVERALDRRASVYLSLYGKRTKRSGFARLMPSGDIERLTLADASLGGLIKA